MTYRSDKSEGPTAGTETADPLEFLARVLVHIPDKGHVTTRYYGWYANRPRGMRRQAEPVAAVAPPAIVPAPRLAPTEAARRWATLLQQIFEVDPLACPSCHGVMRIVAFITQPCQRGGGHAAARLSVLARSVIASYTRPTPIEFPIPRISYPEIIAAPTLIKKLPLPPRRFIGDMSHTKKILLGLELREKGTKSE